MIRLSGPNHAACLPSLLFALLTPWIDRQPVGPSPSPTPPDKVSFKCGNFATPTRLSARREYKPLPACGSLDTPYKIRALMRRVISHQLKGEISTTAHSAINGSAGLALKTLQQGEFEERVAMLEEKLAKAMDELEGAHTGKRKKKKRKNSQQYGVPG